MIVSPALLNDQVRWDYLPKSLAPEKKTLLKKIRSVFWNALSFLIPIIGLYRIFAYVTQLLIKSFILPATRHTNKVKNLSQGSLEAISDKVQESHETSQHRILTPDGATIIATFFRDLRAEEQTPTIIYFNGNNSLQGLGSWRWLLFECVQRDTRSNFVTFDYRNTGSSKGNFKYSKDLLIDSSSVVSWVHNKLNIPKAKIYFYGQSLGAAIATITKAIDPQLEGRLLNERSFSSIEDVIHATDLIPKIFKCCIAFFLKARQMDLSVADHLDQLKGKKLFIYHLLDRIVPYQASIARKADQTEVFKLNETIPVQDHHNEHLASYKDACDRVFQFFFQQEI